LLMHSSVLMAARNVALQQSPTVKWHLSPSTDEEQQRKYVYIRTQMQHTYICATYFVPEGCQLNYHHTGPNFSRDETARRVTFQRMLLV
jgi:hypothetical protein